MTEKENIIDRLLYLQNSIDLLIHSTITEDVLHDRFDVESFKDHLDYRIEEGIHRLQLESDINDMVY